MVKLLWRCDRDGLFSELDAIPMFFGHTFPTLLMQLFGLDNCWRGFSMLCFSRFLVGFHGFSMYFHGFSFFLTKLKSLPLSTMRFFCKTIRADVSAMFLRFVDHVRLFPRLPTISPKLRCLLCIAKVCLVRIHSFFRLFVQQWNR